MGNWTQNPHWTPWRNLEQEKMLPTPKLFKSFSLHPKKGIVECGGNQIEHIRARGSLCQHQSLPSLKDEETEAGGEWNDLPRVTQCWRPSWDQICPPQAHACPSSLDTASPRRKGFVFCLFLLQCLAHKNCRSMENPHVWVEMVLFPSQGVDNTEWTLDSRLWNTVAAGESGNELVKWVRCGGEKYIYLPGFFPQRSQNRRVGDKIW